MGGVVAPLPSGFSARLRALLEHLGGQQRQLVVVMCGSAASWMLQNIVRQRGGLHNRVTRRIRVEPFSLADAEELLRSRGVELGRPQTAELYMALGGVPHYLAQVRPGESAAQSIDRLCFARDGLLRTEFTQLYASLTEGSWEHRPDKNHPDGAQLDLVIDRADRSMNLCEMKFSEAEFTVDKAYGRELKNKRDVFRATTRTSKALFLTLVSTYGVRDNEHSRGVVAKSVTIDALFARAHSSP